MKGDAAQKLARKSLRRQAGGNHRHNPKQSEEKNRVMAKKKGKQNSTYCKTNTKRGKEGKKGRKGKNENRKEKQARSS